MKKICFVVEKLYNGGAEKVVSILANALTYSGYTVTIVCYEKGDKEYFVEESVCREYILTKRGTVNRFIRTVKYLLKSDFEIVVGFDILPNLICSFVSVLSRKRIIISERNAPKQVRINPLLRFMRTVLYSFADIIVFQTNEAKNCYRSGIAKKGIVIKNPVTPDLPRRSNVHKKEIVAMGRLTYQKNYELLIRALKVFHDDFPDYILRIFGQGELESDLKALVNKLQANDYIRFEGYYEDACQQIIDSDIYVLTSHYEGLPNSLIEAMCMGFPVISSDCPSGGPKDLIKHGENGLLFKNNDIEDLINQMVVMLSNDVYKEHMGIEAMKIKDDVSLERITSKWIEVINQYVF